MSSYIWYPKFSISSLELKVHLSHYLFMEKSHNFRITYYLASRFLLPFSIQMLWRTIFSKVNIAGIGTKWELFELAEFDFFGFKSKQNRSEIRSFIGIVREGFQEWCFLAPYNLGCFSLAKYWVSNVVLAKFRLEVRF